DGESALIHSAAGDFRNFPVESMESKCPLLIRRYALGPDSGGPGRQRGGLNIVREYEVTADYVDVSLWFDRTHTPAWGLFGGQAGAIPQVVLDPDGPQERHLLKINHLPLAAGTIFRVQTGGGGGYGPPHERPLANIQQDLLDGYISRVAAEKQYGVCLKKETLEIDLEATRSQPGQADRL
ncbi:MAG: hydantoinase B/oxoprolinase family protein, partial [Anaerolineae bacterium]|nr:hydantoinase B/oxoprolinase family protein [Anaerolineae bacterium]